MYISDMKKTIFLIAAIAIVMFTAARAAVPVDKVAKVKPADRVFMDMATTAAAKSVAEKGKPCGAVVIVNNAFKGTGTANESGTAEQNAVTASRLPNLSGAVVYTVCQPTSEAYNTLCRLGASAVYFAVPAETVIARGIYPASAYADAAVDTSLKPVPLRQMDYADAEALVK